MATRLPASVTAAIAFMAMLCIAPASAQTQFNRITDFGDSYADTGYAPGGALRMLGLPCPGATVLPCRFTGSTNFVDSLQATYGLPTATNYAIGGARTDNTNTMTPALPGYQYELQQFATGGTRFSERDLIVLSIGGNDVSGIDLAGLATEALKIDRMNTSAATSAANAVAGVQQLVAAGAHNIAWLSPGNEKFFPEPPAGPAGAFTDAERDAFAHAYFQQIQQALAPLARSGTRIFLFDYETLQQRVAADPGLYGFTSATRCEAGSGTGSTPASVQVNVAGCFYENSVHPTGAAMALIARYMANQIDAPTTVVPQGAITTSLARSFAGSVLDRLDVERTFQPFGFGAAMAYAPAPGAHQIEPEKRWSISSRVDYGSGSGDRQFAAAGYDYTSVGGTLALGYRLDDNWRLGGVFGYSQPDVDLGVQNAHNRINAYQFAGYASFTDADWFADALLAYGRQDFALDRQGVISNITGSTSADIFTAALRGGRLFDVGGFRLGPIAGLTYVRAVIHGYIETGDTLLTMMVDRQSLDDLTAHAGVEVRYPFILGDIFLNPFVDVTAEHQFLGSGRIVTTTQVTTPVLPVLTAVPDADRTYGKVVAGVAAAITKSLSASLTASTTFGRDGTDDTVVSTGVKVAF
jgi:outer membrane lipase/esterase